MNDNLSIRVTSFALAAAVTFSVVASLDVLARERHTAGQPMSQTDSTPSPTTAKSAPSAECG